LTPRSDQTQLSERTTSRCAAAPADTPHLELRGINAGYGAMKALFDVDVAVPAGRVVALLGPNGAGKTTTLRVASGLLAPTRGTVRLAGRDVTGARPRTLARAGVCLVPEGRGVFPNLTVRENLLLHTYAATQISAAEVEEVAYQRFPVLRSRRDQVAGTMSGGEQQMLALSRALTTKPGLLLLDEISMGLAPRLVEQLFEVISAEVAARQVTVLIVEQLAEFALRIADVAVVLSRGSVIATGSPNDVRSALDAAYLGRTDEAATTP
jgi:branched-chain amino acid transport system ATP-binding protein